MYCKNSLYKGVLLYLFLVVLISGATLGCTQQQKLQDNFYKELVVQGSNNVSLKSLNVNELENYGIDANFQDTVNKQISELFFLLPENYILLGYNSTSLDANDVEEHIILYSTKDDDTVHILIATYDIATNRYDFVWQEITNIKRSENSMRMEIKDITNDYGKEIIVLGFSGTNKVIDIFQMQTPEDIKTYRNIFSRTATGIDILEKNQQQIYEDVETTIFVYEIIVVNESDNGVISREYFNWNGNDMVRTSIESFSQFDITQEKLSSLSRSSSKEIEKFLLGAWYKKNELNIVKPNQKNSMGVVFTSLNIPEVIMYGGEETYWYTIQSSFRNIAKRNGISLHMNMQSKILPSTFDWMQVEILSENSAYIEFNENFSIALNGEYFRVKDNEDIKNFTSENQRLIYGARTLELLEMLKGKFEYLFKESSYIFEYPRVYITKDGQTTNTYFSMFDLNDYSVLEVQIKDEKNLFYAITEIEGEDKLSFKLQEIDIFYNGFYFKENSVDIILTKSDE